MISNDIGIPALIITALFGVGVYLILRPYRKAKDHIENWATENNYTIHKIERKVGFDTGPFIFGGWTAIYKVSVGDPERVKRVIWTKTGSYLWPFSNTFIVKDDH